MKKLALFIFINCFIHLLNAQNIRYVKTVASGTGDGSSWNNASSNLQAMINQPGVTQVWIAAGTYLPTTDPNGNTNPADAREKTFVLRNNIALYGGFSGAATDTSLTQRNWYAGTNITTLSGDIGTLNNNSDNSYHVLYASVNNTSANILLDGLNITGGNANVGNGINATGGGLYANFSAVNFNNCKLFGNAAKEGGAIYSQNTSISISNAIISGNYASAIGGAIRNIGTPGYFSVVLFPTVGSLTMINSLVSGNRSDAVGGAIASRSIDMKLTNCTFASNSAGNSASFLDNNGSLNALGNMANFLPVVENCIVWGNTCDISTTSLIVNINASPNITFTLLQSGFAGYNYAANGSIDANPLFVAPLPSGLNAGGNYNLQSCSPAIDLANEALNASAKDLAGEQRIVNSSFQSRNNNPPLNLDMGAYEYPLVWSFLNQDADGDGFGSQTFSEQRCAPSPGWLTDNTDCNDASATEKPGQVWYKDADGDNYGSANDATIVQCSRPVNYKAAVELAGINDCNDNNANINPGIAENCSNSIDDNCDGIIDFGNFPNPVITSTSGFAFCFGDSVLLTSNFATGNFWSTGATTQSIWVKNTGNYKVTVTTGAANGCSLASDIVTVSSSAFGFNNMYIQYVCPGINPEMGINVVAGNTYSWSPSAGLSNVNIPNPVVTATQNTTYFVTETTPQGCVLRDTVQVVMANNPTFTPIISINNNSCSTYSILNVPGADTLGSISWQLNGNTVLENIIQPEIIAPKTNDPFRVDGFFVAKNGDVYIGNSNSSQVEKWIPDAKFPIIVAGGNGIGAALNQVRPSSVAVDDAGNVFVLESLNERVTKWAPGATQGVIVASPVINGTNIVLDATGNMYISSRFNAEVRKWVQGASSGIVVAGGNGSGGALNQIQPFEIMLDDFNNLYIADGFNYRVVKWAPGATQGVVVAGGNGLGTAPNQLGPTSGVDMDQYGNIFVCDLSNRVTKWAPGATQGTVVAGYGTGLFNNLSFPRSVRVDDNGVLYISNNTSASLIKGGYRNTTSYQANSSGSYTATVFNAQGCGVTSAPVTISINNIFSPGNAINFDGVDDHVTVPARITCPNQFTLEAWFRTTVAQGPIVGFNSDSIGFNASGGFDKFIYMEATGQLVFGVFTSVINTITSPLSYNDGRYHHVAATCSQADGIKLYVDGKLVAQQATLLGGNIIAYSGFWRIGGLRNWSSNNANVFNGSIDEVRIWNGPRNAQKIKDDYLKIVNPNFAGLTHYYRMNEGVANGNNTAVTTIIDQTCKTNALRYNLNANGTSSNWVESYAMVVPIATAATNISTQIFRANWKPSVLGIANNYFLDVATDSTFTSFVAGYNSKSVNDTSDLLSSLTPGTTYYYRVRANKTSVALQGGFSNTIKVTTTPCVTRNSIFTVTACSSYTWVAKNNKVYTSSNNTDTIKIITALGCDSIVTLNLTINNVTAAINPSTVSICNGQSTTLTATGGGTYVWSNSGGSNATATFSPTSTTTYSVTVTGTNTCTATASRLVTVNASPTAAINPSTVSICNGQSTTLTASGGTTYAWSNSGGNNAAATYSPAANTTYTVTVTNANNCSATATRLVTVNQLPTAAINGPTTICSGLQATLTASGGTLYSWDNNLGTGDVKTVSPTTSTTYTVTVTDANNCSATASQTISVTTIPTASISGNTQLCAGESVTLTANGGNTYEWANNLGTTSSISVAPTATTTYSVTATIGANCTATASQTITVYQAQASQFSETICAGNSYLFNGIQLSQSGNYNDTLQTINGCDSIVTLNLTVNAPLTGNFDVAICNGESYTFNAQQLTQSGSYADTIQTTQGCDSIVTLNLTVNNSTSFSFSQDICQGSSFVFNNQNLTTAGSYFDTLVNAVGCDSFITLNLSLVSVLNTTIDTTICAGNSFVFDGINLTSSGSYFDTVITTTGCDSIITLNLTVADLPLATVIQNGNNLSTQLFDNYQWLKDNQPINGANNQNYEVVENGDYSVVVSDVNGCADTSNALNVTFVNINVQSATHYALYPNPNNGIFSITTNNLLPEQLLVMNALGQKINAVITKSSENRYNLDMQHYASGIYTCEIKSGEKYFYLKFVVTK